jgi:predicted RNA-binding Zn ribbon-like protein
VQFNTYTAAGSLIAADLVNHGAAGPASHGAGNRQAEAADRAGEAHRAGETDRAAAAAAADRAALSGLLDRYDVHVAAVSKAAAASIRAWTELLRPVFETAVPAGKAALVDRLLIAAACQPRLVSHDDLAHHLHYAPLEASLPARVRALTASGLAHLIADGAGHRLGCCQRDGCPVVFVDVSRAGRRHFCSVRCANAVNVRLHRARHHPNTRPTARS